MENYIEAELVEIKDEQVVVLDGVKYLVLGKLSEPRHKKSEVKKATKKVAKKKPRRKILPKAEREERDTKIRAEVALGKPVADIAKETGLTKSRIQQLVKTPVTNPPVPPTAVTMNPNQPVGFRDH